MEEGGKGTVTEGDEDGRNAPVRNAGPGGMGKSKESKRRAGRTRPLLERRGGLHAREGGRRRNKREGDGEGRGVERRPAAATDRLRQSSRREWQRVLVSSTTRTTRSGPNTRK